MPSTLGGNCAVNSHSQVASIPRFPAGGNHTVASSDSSLVRQPSADRLPHGRPGIDSAMPSTLGGNCAVNSQIASIPRLPGWREPHAGSQIRPLVRQPSADRLPHGRPGIDSAMPSTLGGNCAVNSQIASIPRSPGWREPHRRFLRFVARAAMPLGRPPPSRSPRHRQRDALHPLEGIAPSIPRSHQFPGRPTIPRSSQPTTAIRGIRPATATRPKS